MKNTVLQYGERSVLVELSEANPLELLSSLKTAIPEAEIRPGLSSLLISFTNAGKHVETVSKILPNLKLETTAKKSQTVLIPVQYTGEDLETASQQLGLSVAELISIHTSIDYEVQLIGFAPGFPYLSPVTESEGTKLLARIGRLATPRRTVPAGSVGLAAGMSCIYPSVMPGGWQLIGITDFKLFDSSNIEDPTTLHLGDVVRFQVKP